MKKLILSIAVMAFSLNASAQFENTTMQNLDVDEDTANVTTIDDIVAMQQKVLTSSNTEKHYNDVWGRRSFFNISTNSETMKTSGTIATEEGEQSLRFKSDWGVGIQSGTNYRLHKKAIANIMSIALDYSWLELNVQHFKAEKNAAYNSSVTNGGKYYMPWTLQKYEANYSMTLGPSVTFAPFTPLNIKELDYVRFQLYYHIGYGASLVYIVNNKKYDTNTETNSSYYKDMSSNAKLNWALGLSNAIGFNITWKGIGFGYEHRNASYKYKAINTDDFGKAKNKFKQGLNRFFIQFRM